MLETSFLKSLLPSFILQSLKTAPIPLLCDVPLVSVLHCRRMPHLL